jgi:hypothetical protein
MGVAGASVGTAISWDKNQPTISGNGQVPFIIHGCTDANTQTFKAGCPVSLDSSGNVIIAATADVPIAGIALVDGTNGSSSTTEIPILCGNADSEWLVQVSNGSGVYEAANKTCKEGVAYDIEVTTGTVTIASDDTTNPKFVVVGYLRDVNGDVTTWAKCRQFYLENQPIAGV